MTCRLDIREGDARVGSSLLSLPQAGRYACVLADPPWHWKAWADQDPVALGGRAVERHYDTLTIEEIAALPVAKIAAPDCVLMLWFTWPLLRRAFEIVDAWGFEYKTCAFNWMKADVSTLDLFALPKDADMKLGFWTRSNSEACLLATRGRPKRRDAGVRMGIIEPAREHSRKPDCVHDRIERLVAGPYVELFARQTRPGWDCWGNETTKFKATG